MGFRRKVHLPFAAVVLAALACLQPGIDPVFLALLSRAHHVPFAFHGWIVGATQAGMALGSLIAWRMGARPPLRLEVAAAAALCAGLATAAIAHPLALATIRFGYGTAMGLVYTQAMAQAAAHRPSGAYGTVFLSQLLLSAAVAPALPLVAQAGSERFALGALCIVPLAAILLALRIRPAALTAVLSGADHSEQPRAGSSAWLYAIAAFLFVAATMMVWTFVGALAVTARLGEDLLGEAVAIGSVAGAVTAFAVLRERPLVPPALTGVAASLTLLAPIPATGSAGSAIGFVIAIVLFNIGSTAIIVRTSALASSASGDLMFRRFVSCTHCLGMIAGPLAGSGVRMALGEDALLYAAIMSVTAGCCALFAATILSAQRAKCAAAPKLRLNKLRLMEPVLAHPRPFGPPSKDSHVRRTCEQNTARREIA